MAIEFIVKSEKNNDFTLYADRFIVAGDESYHFGESVYICFNEQDRPCYLIPISNVRYIRVVEEGFEIPIAHPDATYTPKMFIEGDAAGSYAIDYHHLRYSRSDGWNHSGILLYEHENSKEPFVQLPTESVSYILFLNEQTVQNAPLTEPEVRETSTGSKSVNIPRRMQRN